MCRAGLRLAPTIERPLIDHIAPLLSVKLTFYFYTFIPVVTRHMPVLVTVRSDAGHTCIQTWGKVTGRASILVVPRL